MPTIYDAPRWSTLRALGLSPILRLTALAPIFGGLIFLNDQVTRLLHSASFDNAPAPAAVLGFIPLSRLELTYLGLTLLGIASLAFTWRCPAIVKRFESATEWLKTDEAVLTRTRLFDLLTLVVAVFYHHTDEQTTVLDDVLIDGEPLRRTIRTRKPSYSNAQFSQVNMVLVDIGERIIEAKPSLERYICTDPEAYVKAESVAYCIFHNLPATREFELALLDAANSTRADIVRLAYHDIDCWSHKWRWAVAALFALGFTVLAIPTAHTVGLILLRGLGF